MIRVIKWLLRGILRLLYRVDCRGLEHYKAAGDRVLIVANHTSLLDGLLLYAWLPETPTFAINTNISRQSRFSFFLKFVDLFTMDPTSPLSVKSLIRYLREDNKAVIFPEGRITTTGALMKIYEGPGLVADRAEAMVLPIGIDGPQYSPFSYLQGKGLIRWFPRITMRILPPRRIQIDKSLQGQARRRAAATKLQDIMYELFPVHTITGRQPSGPLLTRLGTTTANGSFSRISSANPRPMPAYCCGLLFSAGSCAG
ncbi:MAG: 1-acyl-sn-glycerol-3-phosphate acyltransferase [Gammaproteobacteria bacterium]|nr:1-acyl-sn-glycerol-3-phosphate acyltransferase [Gammaproteobacteria bacterium]